MAQKGYTTKEAVENYMLKDIAVAFNTQIDDWIEGVENTIDLITGRNFIADAVGSARVFDGSGELELIIDDCVAITKVELGNDDYGGTFTTIDATGSERYFSAPANHLALLVPVTKLVLRTNRWTKGMQNHQVTAKWGYSIAVPADIKRAATVLVAGIINQNSPATQNVKTEKIGNYSVSYANDVDDSFADFNTALATLDSYKRYYL